MKKLINLLSQDKRSLENYSDNLHSKTSNWFLLAGAFSSNNASKSP